MSVQTFTNPYQGYDNDSIDTVTGERLACRMQTFIEKRDYRHIQCIRPGSGTISIVVGILFRKLVLACEARKIKDMGDVAAFERFVAECQLVVPSEGDNVKPQKKEKVKQNG